VLVADPVALVLAVREGEPSLLDGADLRVLRIAGLDRRAAARLVEHEGLQGDTLERLYRETAGNPLALLELASAGARVSELPGEAPLPISARIAGSFVRRVGRLPLSTRRLLTLAAASGAGGMGLIAGAAGGLGLEVADLAPAEEVGLVTLDGHRLAFRHPLVRSAIYAEAPVEERRQAHAALAGVLADGEAG